MTSLMVGILLQGRQRAEALMLDSCTVRRDTGEKTTDPVTYGEVPVYAPIYAGLKCKLKAATTQANAVQVPGQTVVLSGMQLHVPMSTLGILTNDLVTIDTVDPVSGDADMVGKVLRITGPFMASAATARRFSVEVAS